jgi:tetratricopeptide (TPR) repeat protein
MLKPFAILIALLLATGTIAAEPSTEAAQLVAIAHMRKGHEFLQRGRLPQAESEFDLAILSYPDGPALYGLRGKVRFQRKNYPGAVQDFDKYLGTNPTDLTIAVLRGLAKSLLTPEDKVGACVDFLKAQAQAKELHMEKYCQGEPGW